MRMAALASKKNVILLGLLIAATLVFASSSYVYGRRVKMQTRLGYQLELVTSLPINVPQYRFFNELGALKLSRVTDMEAAIPLSGAPLETNVRLIDSNYPLYGRMHIDTGKLDDAFLEDKTTNTYGIAVNQPFLAKYNYKHGDKITVGGVNYQIRGIIRKLPDISESRLESVPLIMMRDTASVPARIIDFGDKREFRYRVRGERPTDQWEQQFRERFPELAHDMKFNHWND